MLKGIHPGFLDVVVSAVVVLGIELGLQRFTEVVGQDRRMPRSGSVRPFVREVKRCIGRADCSCVPPAYALLRGLFKRRSMSGSAVRRGDAASGANALIERGILLDRGGRRLHFSELGER